MQNQDELTSNYGFNVEERANSRLKKKSSAGAISSSHAIEMEAELRPAFFILDEREVWMNRLVAVVVALVLLFVLGLITYIVNPFKRYIPPEPSLSSTSIQQGYQYDFYHEGKTYIEANKVCEFRGGSLVIFNNTEEHSKFNEFVNDNFKPYVDNHTTNIHKKRGLQIWTGLRIAFKAEKKPLLFWPGKQESSQAMQHFYKDSEKERICLVTSMERVKQFKKAKSSKKGEEHYVVKDFSGKFVNILKEPGCWQIRIIDEGDKLKLPFACKKRTSETVN